MNSSVQTSNRQGSQTLARGINILSALRDAPEGLSVAELRSFSRNKSSLRFRGWTMDRCR
jgi:hypothetical protein